MDSTTVKPGWKTTEFWGKLAVQLFTVVYAVKGFVPVAQATVIIGVLEGVYNLARTLVKATGSTELPDLPNH